MFDGLKGLAEAIETVFPQTTVQTCIVHLFRDSLRFINYRDRKRVSAALRPIYTAPSAAAAGGVPSIRPSPRSGIAPGSA